MASLLRLYGLTGLLLAACAVTAAAQSQLPPPAWASVVRLTPGSEIRVTLSGGRTLHGFLQSVTSDSLAVNAATSHESLPRPEIQRIQLKRAGHRGRNTLIGLAAGLAGGLAVGAYVDSRDHIWLFSPNDGKKVFSAAGGIVGAVAGVVVPTGGWREVYRAR